MRKYLAIFLFNLKTQMNFKVDFVFSLFSFAIHVFIFNELWNFILKDKQILGYTKSDLIWYIIIGELLYYTIGKNYKKISDMIKNGEIANMLTKPVNFLLYFFAEDLSFIVNFGINIVFSIFLGLIMSGPLDLTILNILMLIVSVILSLLILLLMQILIGFIAFITEENQAFWLIMSKFILLVIMTPIEFFPTWLYNIFRILPTTYITYPAGKILVHYSATESINLILLQLITLVLVFATCILLERKGVKNINVNGG